MARAIVLAAHGGPEALALSEVAVGAPGPGEIRVRQTAVGVNFHDVYVRSGLYRTLALPGIPGIEAVGVVEEAGPGALDFRPGDRVGYVTAGYGGYASERLLDAALAVRIPDAVGDVAAASVLLKGLTARMLLRQVHAVRPGDAILIHAASGGVGRLLVAWAARLGCVPIATVGSAAKAAEALRLGAHAAILYREEDFVARVRDLTGGRGVAVAYDSVGRDTFAGSLACLAPRGHLVNFGQSSGPVEPFAVSSLGAKSNTLSRPMLFHYVAERPALEEAAAELFAAVGDGTLDIGDPATLKLAEAGEAHRRLESRATTGAVVLLP